MFKQEINRLRLVVGSPGQLSATPAQVRHPVSLLGMSPAEIKRPVEEQISSSVLANCIIPFVEEVKERQQNLQAE